MAQRAVEEIGRVPESMTGWYLFSEQNVRLLAERAGRRAGPGW